mmetsp:Transcript_42320/g.86505  ORF Transcript_42320/g.86505 Transcript_42320/m.86505 type:complete len:184 (-) Transcript_42320:270-821(-)
MTWETWEAPPAAPKSVNLEETYGKLQKRCVPTFRHTYAGSAYRNCVKVQGLSSSDISGLIRNNAILYVLGICPTTFVEAYRIVESLTTKQLQQMASSSIKRANTTFRIHSLDRALNGYLTADLPVEPNTPGVYRLIFKHRNNTVKCVGLIDDHKNAQPFPTGHQIFIKDKAWPGISLDELLCF